MRKKIIVLIIISLFIISGIYAWEGAAATAPDGELPSTGRYIATNSFPRNTVVDITNIETNRSTRVIVANSLDSPGLLAVVSREAAELIGMRPGSISRIRMSQPSDPIAYLRFTEGLAAGIPEFDSGNVITEENYEEEIAWAATPPETAEASVPPVNGAPGYLLETEWGGRRTGIVDLPEYIVSEEPPNYEFLNEPVEIAEYIPEEEVIEPVEEIAAYIPEEAAEEPVVEIAEYIPEEEVVVEEVVEYIPEEVVVEEIAEYVPEEEVVVEVAEIPEEVIDDPAFEPVGEIAEYIIVPAQERPPSEPGTIYGIDPADIIPGISRIIPEPEAAPDAALSILLYEVEPIRQMPAAEEERISSAIPASPQPQTAVLEVSRVPSISTLNRGAYYVQIAALESVESVEKAIDMIDLSYGPVVYNDGSSWYRILLGPLNQGESAAILQRFKSIGYRDAFVRHVR